MVIQMPKMDGFEATAQICRLEMESGGRIYIVSMTAHAMKEGRERGIEAGMEDCIPRAIQLKKMVEVIE